MLKFPRLTKKGPKALSLLKVCYFSPPTFPLGVCNLYYLCMRKEIVI